MAASRALLMEKVAFLLCFFSLHFYSSCSTLSYFASHTFA
jgi:hypothetical protein